MALSLHLYNNTDDIKTVHKNPTFIKTVNCDIYDDSDVLKPVFIVDANQIGLTNISNINYVHFPIWNRFYYATVSVNKHICTITCDIDALKSWENDINNLECNIARNEFEYDLSIPDNNIVINSERVLTAKEFGTELITGETDYVIGVI